jgi:tRNA(fMet)-specific endonuclease VapC
VKYLLDTSTCIEFFNRRSEKLLDRLAGTQDADVAVASIVKAELLTGALKRPDRERAQRLEASLFRRYASIPFDDLAAEHYASIRFHLEAIGRPIGANDLMIAATARSRGLIVITKNRSEFDRVPDLIVEDWTAA